MRITEGAVGTVTLVGDVNVIDIPGDSYESLAPVTVANTATLLHAGAAGTKSLIIKADPDNSEPIFIGDANITDPGTTEDGTPMAAGSVFILTTTAAVYAISDTGSQKAYLSRVYNA
tara:strand:- start:2274 stop:2624 length:351 start_codon:yes stop_codon:yes gene_type:complete